MQNNIVLVFCPQARWQPRPPAHRGPAVHHPVRRPSHSPVRRPPLQTGRPKRRWRMGRARAEPARPAPADTTLDTAHASCAPAPPRAQLSLGGRGRTRGPEAHTDARTVRVRASADPSPGVQTIQSPREPARPSRPPAAPYSRPASQAHVPAAPSPRAGRPVLPRAGTTPAPPPLGH